MNDVLCSIRIKNNRIRISFKIKYFRWHYTSISGPSHSSPKLKCSKSFPPPIKPSSSSSNIMKISSLINSLNSLSSINSFLRRINFSKFTHKKTSPPPFYCIPQFRSHSIKSPFSSCVKSSRKPSSPFSTLPNSFPVRSGKSLLKCFFKSMENSDSCTFLSKNTIPNNKASSLKSLNCSTNLKTTRKFHIAFSSKRSQNAAP